MSIHKVVIEIEVEANNPLEAALELREITKDNKHELQYYVQDENGDMYSIDLAEKNKDAVLPIIEYNPLIVQPE